MRINFTNKDSFHQLERKIKRVYQKKLSDFNKANFTSEVKIDSYTNKDFLVFSVNNTREQVLFLVGLIFPLLRESDFIALTKNRDKMFYDFSCCTPNYPFTKRKEPYYMRTKVNFYFI